jgi:hypothetical protein
MPRFKCLFHGYRFSITDHEFDADEIIGFYTTRFISANNHTFAKEYALESLRAEKEVQALIEQTKKKGEKEPEIEIEEIEEVPLYMGLFSKASGFSFYTKDE